MTDTEVETFLINHFETECASLLTSKIVNSKTVYTNVSFQNKSFTRPSDGYWFELIFLPTTPYQQELGHDGGNRWNGILQVNICIPQNTGTAAANARYNKIYSAFPRGFITNGIRILSVAHTSARAVDDYCSMSVSIAWQADLAN